MKCMLISIFMIVLSSSAGWADTSPDVVLELQNDTDRTSYSLGYQIGGDYKREGRSLDSDAFLKGIEDALADMEPEISRKEMHTTLMEVKKKIIARQRSEKLEMKEQLFGEGEKFLKENAKKDGVITLPSGLQYKIIRAGTGRHPSPSDKVAVHYKGTMIDGTEFGSSYRTGEPETFYVNGVISGLAEALRLMKEGAKWQLFIPAEIAYGKRGALADRTVLFDLELISIEPSK